MGNCRIAGPVGGQNGGHGKDFAVSGHDTKPVVTVFGKDVVVGDNETVAPEL